MVKKLEFKPCRICGRPVTPIPRKDRKAFWYPRQCEKCKGQPRNNALRIERLARTMSGKGNPRYRPIGSKRLAERRGVIYREIKVADPNVWQYEHRFVMENQLGRPLKSYELVHHIDGNGLNNEPQNLQLTTTALHNKTHVLIMWSRKFKECRRCHSTEYPHLCHGLCKHCYAYLKYHQELSEWIN